MSRIQSSGPSRQLIRAYRYEMMLEALQLILTDAGWLKHDLANYLEIEYELVNKLLTRRYYPVDARLMRKVKKLYQQKYGPYQWRHIYTYIKRSKMGETKQALQDKSRND